MRTLYRIFKRSNVLDVTSLPMKGKRHPNGYVERRGKAGRLGRALSERHQDYPNYHNEFGHLEADTIQGKNHRGAVMTLVERKSKAVIILNTRLRYFAKVVIMISVRYSLRGAIRMKQKRNIGLFVTLGLCVLVLITFFSIWSYYLSKKQDIPNEESKVSTLAKKTSSVRAQVVKNSKRRKASSTTIIFSKGGGA